MSRSIRKETSSLAFGIVGGFGGSSAGLVVAALKAASAVSREVVVLRVLSAGIYVLALGLHFSNANWVAILKHTIRLCLNSPQFACGGREGIWPVAPSAFHLARPDDRVLQRVQTTAPGCLWENYPKDRSPQNP
jgi:hypothetical protein